MGSIQYSNNNAEADEAEAYYWVTRVENGSHTIILPSNLGFGRRSGVTDKITPSRVKLRPFRRDPCTKIRGRIPREWRRPPVRKSRRALIIPSSILTTDCYPTYSFSVSFCGLRVPHELPASLHTGIVPSQYASKLGPPVQSQLPTQHRLAVPISEEPLQADLPRSRRSNTDPLLFERKGLLLLRYNYWMRCHLRNPLSEAFLITARVARL